MKSTTNDPVPQPLPRLVYTIQEACKVSTLGRATIFNKINSGHLRVVRVGGRTLVNAESLRALVTGGDQ